LSGYNPEGIFGGGTYNPEGIFGEGAERISDFFSPDWWNNIFGGG
jgi:hypothetical protein